MPFRRLFFVLGLVIAAGAIQALPAASAQQPTLRQELHAQTIRGHLRLPDVHETMTDTFDGLSLADSDPDHPGEVLTIYGNQWLPGGSSGDVILWNREHLWPQSYGMADLVCDFAVTDLHALRPSEPGLNTSRGNSPFGWCPSCEPKNLKDGSGRANLSDDKTWQVWDGRRGDVARALFYMDVRYEGEVERHGNRDCDAPDLRLTNDRSLIVTTTFTAQVAFMGILKTLQDWHLQDPPDEGERRRNGVVEQLQGNRNPFVDDPDLAGRVWGRVLLPLVGGFE